MSPVATARPESGQRRFAALLGYVALVAGLAILAVVALGDLYQQFVDVSANANLLEQMEGRKAPSAQGVATSDLGAAGSPFLEGRTVTVAGAALQQRVDAAVKKAGGAVLSSQIELLGPQSKDGFVSLAANFEIDQPALQQLLYDLEAGMPFLFIDMLSVQAPQAVGDADGARMRVVIGVSGQWQGTK